MDLQIKDQFFIVGGASSGLGRAVALRLLQEGAEVLGIARNADALRSIEDLFTGRFSFVAEDVTSPGIFQEVINRVGGRPVHGALINAGGPPAKRVMETTAEDWDDAYRKILKWKVLMAQTLVPMMQANNYGRLLFLESAAIKQPIENLVLSNSLRMAVWGFAKTLSLEIAASGITVNVMAPGSHNTSAIERLYKKKSEQTGLAEDVVRQDAIRNIPVQALGEADDFAELGAWLLSPASRYVTGQLYLVDGGSSRGT
ncbi:MAG TPA: SDR family oxidoreductase [Phnomibacter sp.]|nr:SDR family oxidoreductase [Phnomibacter sp.]